MDIPICKFQVSDDGETSAIDLRAMSSGRSTQLPACLKIVLENLARQVLLGHATTDLVAALSAWTGSSASLTVPLKVSRLILPDSSGLPLLMDLAAARDALCSAGARHVTVEPEVPMTLVIDHSLIVDVAGCPEAFNVNITNEYKRNSERYSFFKWAQQAFENLCVVPPGAGIIHQIHLERLAMVVEQTVVPGQGALANPEFVLGCDSHTPMVNGLGLLAWGIGGIEGEAVALGQRHEIRIQRVVGVRLTGRLPAGSTTTDLVLTITQKLRDFGVVGDFVEFFGEGVAGLSVPERATIANMAPEYGATIGFFAIDERTIEYLEQSGRPSGHVRQVEAFARATGLFVEDHTAEAEYSAVVSIDLTQVGASLAGPKRPQERVDLSQVREAFHTSLAASVSDGGFGLTEEECRPDRHSPATRMPVRHGSIVVAAITSCTNTSNPSVMIGAGLVARNAVKLGLKVPGWVKTSLAPGSRLVADYLDNNGLLAPLEHLGFHVVGFGCTTCSGKSGPISEDLAATISDNDLVAVAILSGNRNFEGRIHPSCRASYLASPALVVAFALAGRIDIDLESEPLGMSPGGQPVYLRDIWPDQAEIDRLVRDSQQPEQFRKSYANLFDGARLWQELEAPGGRRFQWQAGSTYVCQPPFFRTDNTALPDRLTGARALLMVGDSTTTDHITPSGQISPDTEAGQYLMGLGVRPDEFNAVTQRRGNHEFMARVTFANQRLANLLAPGCKGGLTRIDPDGPVISIYQAAGQFRSGAIPAIVIAGRDYGMGSSRDWAAKGPRLLGVRAVLAEGFERIHRSNLVGMGIVPLVFEAGRTAGDLKLSGFERFDFVGLHEAVASGKAVRVTATAANEDPVRFVAHVDIASDAERDLLLRGGMFAALLDRLEAVA